MRRSFLFFILAMFFCVASKVQAALPTDGLVGYWKLDQGSGLTAEDSSGNSNNGTLTNGPTWTGSGYSGDALSFTGDSNLLSMPSLYNTAFPTSGTLSFWIKTDFNQAAKNIFDKWTGQNDIFIRTQNTYCSTGPGLQFTFEAPGNYRFVRNSCGLSSNTWTHIAVSWDTVGHKGYVYINGALDYTADITDASWTPSQQSFIFGGYGGFTGSLDEIRLYNRVLSAAEEFDIFTAGGSGTSGPDTWYSRPFGACQFSGNGKSYDCADSPGTTGAFIGNASIAWAPVSGVDDGDVLYMCGEHVSDWLTVPSGASGSPGSPISVNFDCPGDPGSIRMITVMTVATDPSNWTKESDNVWYLSTAPYINRDPRRLWVDGTEKVPAQDKSNLGARYKTGPVSDWWNDSVNSRLYYYSPDNPAVTFSRMESLVQKVDNRCYGAALCIADHTVNHIDVVNPKLYGGESLTVRNRGGDYIRIYGTAVDDSACIISSNKYLVLIMDDSTDGTGDPAQYNEIHDCTIDSAYPPSFNGYAFESVLTGDGIFISRSSNNHIYSNTVKNTGHAAIVLNSSSSYAPNATTPTDNNIVEDNILRMDPELWVYGRAIGCDGTPTAPARNNIFRRNVIDGWTIRSQINGINTQVVNNIFKNQRKDPVYTPARSEMLSFEGYAGVSEGHLIANNVFFNDPYAPCISFREHTYEKRNITITNNVLSECYDQLYGTGAALYVIKSSNLYPNNIHDITFNNNLIYNSNTAFPPVHYRGAGYSVAAFQAACTDGDVCIGNLASYPDLDANLLPRYTSPAIDAGAATILTADYLGNPIYGAPDIGAFEYQPPLTIGAAGIDIGAGARIYGDGKFRYLAATGGATANLSVSPQGGGFPAYSATDTRPLWLDISGITWSNTGDRQKQWTESSPTPDATGVLHTVGDLAPNTYYAVAVDGVNGSGIAGPNCSAGACLSDFTGKAAFTYSGGYAGGSRVFSVTASNLPAPACNALLNSVCYDSLSAAYQAITGNDGLIYLRNLILPEEVNLNRDVTVTISGGYDPGFVAGSSSNTGWTIIRGALKMRSGRLALERVKIR